MRPTGESTTDLTDFEPDRVVSVWFTQRSVEHPWLVDLGEVVAVALHPWTFRVAVAAACVLAWRSGFRRTAVVAGVTMAAGSLLGVGLKLLIARPRPAWGDPVAVEIGYSMPSGHALNSALGVGLLLVLAWPVLRTQGRRAAAVAVGAAVVLVTALDRLVMGVHYLSDVTVGVLVGGGAAALAGWVTRRSPRVRRERHVLEQARA